MSGFHQHQPFNEQRLLPTPASSSVKLLILTPTLCHCNILPFLVAHHPRANSSASSFQCHYFLYNPPPPLGYLWLRFPAHGFLCVHANLTHRFYRGRRRTMCDGVPFSEAPVLAGGPWGSYQAVNHQVSATVARHGSSVPNAIS